MACVHACICAWARAHGTYPEARRTVLSSLALLPTSLCSWKKSEVSFMAPALTLSKKKLLSLSSSASRASLLQLLLENCTSTMTSPARLCRTIIMRHTPA